ncbi:histidinol-phosphatase HisJ family protein [uncultured Cetobacterium sp.]|uniref:histidinol-phosphatase HisJ family protein n=1 Tax=uncultured Cetobacterium sp. TaxID=527638 RepID=UPI00262B35EB|nr:histidinol-phosphatase HisJ family protein [uncultured Cetobacterium sp.]
MIISDYHIHSDFSGDSVEKLEKIINRAKELELKEIAITDHMDLDIIDGKNGLNFILDLDTYIPKLQELKERHKKQLEIKIGMEFGIQKHLGKKAKEIIEKYPFDFIISSVHSVDRLLLDQNTFWEDKSRDEAHEKYFFEILKSIESYNNFCVQGHLDFITRYGALDKKGFIDYIKYSDIIDEIFKKLIVKNKGIEINTSGIRYMENRFYPSDKLIKRYFELGGEIITIGSDSHKASDIGKDFKRAYDFLQSIGVRYISSFDSMEASFKKIK